ncbi:hypothetical protein FGG08_000666 [Glutinoglossum americanum]|uniref:Arf-GAP domain-containing protein n=1 Tax=Glutinoglossum americanum TaxID=1670608 RepID=A0A9P8IG29_9PEZI|nr:hypothetical protein FGG08_000666 [Glutinoglossum americanum]
MGECSGIHRGMGTHISRVKSVDLDAWTDEQLQSILQWGNTRANKYWEAKLASGHVPSEAKIENFIRTKYESKRWVMDGGIPDPATLNDEGDDDIPLNLVQEKQKLERSSSTRASSSQPRQTGTQSQDIDLFGDNPFPTQRPATTTPPVTHPPPSKAAPAPPKQTKPGDSLLGLDFFGPPATQNAPPGRPSSAASNPQGSTIPSRPDLKQSILSLYASTPRQQNQSQTQRPPGGAFSNSQSPALLQQPSQQTPLGGLSDAFSGLGFTSSAAAPPQPQQPKPSPFANLGNYSNPRSASTQASSSSSGGGFFNTAPSKSTPAAKPPSPQATQTFSSSSGYDAFKINSTAASVAPTPTPGLGDLFDFSPPQPPPAVPATKKSAASPPNSSSVFNLTAQPPPEAPTQKRGSQSSAMVSTSATLNSGWASTDAWGSNDAWATPDTNTRHNIAASTAAVQPALASTGFGWDSTGSGLEGPSTSNYPPAPKFVSADEDFGGWNSAGHTTSTPKTAAKVGKSTGGVGAGFVGNDDLFSNVWE